jgi:hypothetical protein
VQPTDFARFRAVIVGMGKMYEREIDGPLLDAYWLALRAWELSDFEEAAGQLMGTSEFMPRPAAFNELRKAGCPTSGEAWIRALENSRNAFVCGQVTRGPSCGDPLIDRAAHAIGGYGAIAMCDSSKLSFLEKRFAEHYEAISAAEDVREAVPQLTYGNRGRLSGPTSIRNLLGGPQEPES